MDWKDNTCIYLDLMYDLSPSSILQSDIILCVTTDTSSFTAGRKLFRIWQDRALGRGTLTAKGV